MEPTTENRSRIHVKDMRSAICSLADNESVTALLEAQKNLDDAITFYTKAYKKEIGDSDEGMVAQMEQFCGKIADCSMDIERLFGEVAFYHLCHENETCNGKG